MIFTEKVSRREFFKITGALAAIAAVPVCAGAILPVQKSWPTCRYVYDRWGTPPKYSEPLAALSVTLHRHFSEYIFQFSITEARTIYATHLSLNGRERPLCYFMEGDKCAVTGDSLRVYYRFELATES